MNETMYGMILSTVCFLMALYELRPQTPRTPREVVPQREITRRKAAALLTAAAWCGMATIAWDQTQRCYSLEKRERHEIEANPPKQETPDQARGPVYGQ